MTGRFYRIPLCVALSLSGFLFLILCLCCFALALLAVKEFALVSSLCKRQHMNTGFPLSAAQLVRVSFCVFPAAILLGCGGPPPQQQQAVPEVRYQEVAFEPVTLTRQLPGRISALLVSEVRPQVNGIVQARLFEEGAEVLAGQALYQIDPAIYQAAYNNAQANLGRVKANEEAVRLFAERCTRLAKNNAVRIQERDDAVAAYNQLKAEIIAARESVETAAINLRYTVVKAPVGGRIGRSFVTPGALVTENQRDPLATVQQINPVYVDVTQSSVELLQLRRALAAGHVRSNGKDSLKVRLILGDGTVHSRLFAGKDEPGAPIEGELLFSDVTVEQSTDSVLLRAKFDNPDGTLLPGMYVRAEIEEGVRDNAIVVPQKSVVRDVRGQTIVYVLGKTSSGREGEPATPRQLGENDFYVSARQVVIDRNIGHTWLLSSGLEPGDLLLVDGVQFAVPGQLVSATPAHAAKTSLAQSGR